MIEPYITKVIIVSERFLDDLGQSSITDLDEFANPGLDTRIISLPLRSPTEIEMLSRIMDVSDIRPGRIVVKPSYSDQFVGVDGFSEDLVLRKYGLFVQLCHALGARKVVIKDIEDINLEINSGLAANAKLNASAPSGAAQASVEARRSSSNDELRKSIREIKTEAKGGVPDIPAAERLIEQYGLRHDSLFTDLTNMCKITTNKLSRHELYLDFSKDVRKVFDSSIQAKVGLMGKFYGGGLDFERTKSALEKNRTATKLSIVVEF